MLYSLPLWPDPQKRWSGGRGVGWGVKGVCFWSRKGIVVILNAETLFFFNEQFLEVCDNSQIINNFSFINISSNSWTREARVVILIHVCCVLICDLSLQVITHLSLSSGAILFFVFFFCVCVCVCVCVCAVFFFFVFVYILYPQENYGISYCGMFSRVNKTRLAIL